MQDSGHRAGEIQKSVCYKLPYLDLQWGHRVLTNRSPPKRANRRPIFERFLIIFGPIWLIFEFFDVFWGFGGSGMVQNGPWDPYDPFPSPDSSYRPF